MNNNISQTMTFEEYLMPLKRKDMRNVCGIGFLVVLFFLVIEVILFSTPIIEQILHRDLFLSSILIGLMSTYLTSFDKYYTPLLFFAYLGSITGLLIAVPMLVPEQFVSQIYLGTTSLSMTMVFISSFLKKSVYGLMTLYVIGFLIYMELKIGVSSYENIILTTAFLTAISLIGFYISKLRRQFLLENFNLQQSLLSKVESKTEEAIDNAYLANHDELTKLPNRRHIINRLKNLLPKAKAQGTNIVIVFIDLNGFKIINDKYGHFIGDNVLLSVANRLNRSIKEGDCLARLGGDEFLIGIHLERNQLHKIDDIQNRITNIIAKPMKIEKLTLQVKASIGIATYPTQGTTVEELIDIADKKMYRLKHHNKSTKKIKTSDWFPPITNTKNFDQKRTSKQAYPQPLTTLD